MQGAGEFDEAVGIFGAAITVINGLTEIPNPWNAKGA